MSAKGRPPKRRDRYDVSGNVEAEYITAAKAAFSKKYDRMEAIIRSALARGKKTA